MATSNDVTTRAFVRAVETLKAQIADKTAKLADAVKNERDDLVQGLTDDLTKMQAREIKLKATYKSYTAFSKEVESIKDDMKGLLEVDQFVVYLKVKREESTTNTSVLD